MQRIITLTEQKATEAARRQQAVAAVVPLLTEYARAHGGRYLLFGSAARGQMKFHSDVDLLLDFPADAFGDAWNFAETVCWDRGSSRICYPTGDANRRSWIISHRTSRCWHDRCPLVGSRRRGGLRGASFLGGGDHLPKIDHYGR